jgi:uncharacterized protein (DUF2384 family)
LIIQKKLLENHSSGVVFLCPIRTRLRRLDLKLQAVFPSTAGKIAYFRKHKKTAGMSKGTAIKKYTTKDIPGKINDSEILYSLYSEDINWKHVDAIKQFTGLNDDVLSDWLNISVRTFREYRKPQSSFKENVKEQVLLLLALMKHGAHVFGSMKAFDQWLNTENFHFDNKPPAAFLNTVTGVKFVDDRLTAMAYGDNV